jgi:hypothetical protein
MSKHEKHGGREVKSPHSPEHMHEIETPFQEHGLSDKGPHEGSDPDDYAPHQEHVRKHFHGK